LPPGETRSWNVRLANKGAGVFSPEGPQLVFFCYRWRDSTGTLIRSEEVRTTLPVEMAPGRGVTIPLWLKQAVCRWCIRLCRAVLHPASLAGLFHRVSPSGPKNDAR